MNSSKRVRGPSPSTSLNHLETKCEQEPQLLSPPQHDAEKIKSCSPPESRPFNIPTSPISETLSLDPELRDLLNVIDMFSIGNLEATNEEYTERRNQACVQIAIYNKILEYLRADIQELQDDLDKNK